jgi:hypothetical protein
MTFLESGFYVTPACTCRSEQRARAHLAMLFAGKARLLGSNCRLFHPGIVSCHDKSDAPCRSPSLSSWNVSASRVLVDRRPSRSVDMQCDVDKRTKIEMPSAPSAALSLKPSRVGFCANKERPMTFAMIVAGLHPTAAGFASSRSHKACGVRARKLPALCRTVSPLIGVHGKTVHVVKEGHDIPFVLAFPWLRIRESNARSPPRK